MSARDSLRDASLDAELFEPIENRSTPDDRGFESFDEGEALDDAAYDSGYDEDSTPDASYAAQGLGGSNWLLCTATFSMLAGIGMGAWIAAARETVPLTLLRLGVSPTLLFLTGLVMTGLWSICRRQTALSHQANDNIEPLYAAIDNIAHDVAAALATVSAASDGQQQPIQHALNGLHRLDEKVSNLSRATKMYGKPLIEVANKVERGAAKMVELESTLEKVVVQVASSSDLLASDLGKIRAALPSKDTLNAEKFDQLVIATRQATAMVEELKLDLTTAPTAAGTSIAAVESGVKAVQAQIARLATSIEKLESTPAAVRAPAAAAAAPKADSPASRPPAPEAASRADSNPPAAAKGDNLANSIAGTRKAGGKNVLGAIAKLKSMRH